MKIKTTMKAITNNYNKVYSCGYCDLQHIYRYTEPCFYNAGLYGWNCDIYTEYTYKSGSIAITTGYRNMKGARIPSDLIKKYSEKAKEIYTRRASFEEIQTALTENKNAFIAELENI